MHQPEIHILDSSSKPIPALTKLILAVILITAVVLGLRNFALKQLATQTTDPQLQAVFNKVKQHVLVPKDEIPIMATIQDINLVRPRNELLFREAQNGDRVLRWSNKVVLYSPSQDRVLAVLPMIPSPSATSSLSVQAISTKSDQQEQAVIEVRNGSRIPGAGASMVKKLAAAGLSVLPPSDAKNKTYRKTIIFKANNKALPQTLRTLQSIIPAQLASVAAGEKMTTSDFLVILGADQYK